MWLTAWLSATVFVSRVKHTTSIIALRARNFPASLGVTKRRRKRPSAAKSLHRIPFCTADGTAVYVNRYIEPAYFGPDEVRTEINRLSAKFGERAREIWMPPREGLPRAVMAVWGKIELQQLTAADVSKRCDEDLAAALRVRTRS